MKLKIIDSILLCCILAFFISCKRQNHSKSLRASEKVVTLGRTVSEFDGGIMVIFQDEKNNYWFAGNGKGAYKYNGKSLVLFTMKDGLCSHSILGIQEDYLGNIYFDTHEGVSKFDGQKFTTLEVVESNSSNNEWKLESNDLWFRMGWDKNGPYRYDGNSLYYLEFPKTNQEDEFYSKYPNASFNPYGIYTIYKDSKGAIWFGTASLGLCRYDGESVSWLYEQQLTETPSGGAFGIRSIIEDKDGYFWFCNTQHRYEILSNSFEMNGTFSLNYRKEKGIDKYKDLIQNDYPYFMSIAEDYNGDLWMATYDEGVWQKNGEKLIHYPVKDGEKGVLLFSIYKDNKGVLWLGTHDKGVYRFNGSEFEKFNRLYSKRF